MAGSVRLLLFATAREAVGRKELRLPVPDGGTSVVNLLVPVLAAHPRLAGVWRTCRVVVNGRFVEKDRAVARDGDEVALHPPYSGG